MKQMNTFVPDDLAELVAKIQTDHKPYWSSRGQVVAAGVYALAELMRRLAPLAENATEPDVAELFRRVAHEMPAALVGEQVGWGRLDDGRAALTLGAWWIAEDVNGDLLAVRRDGSAIGGIVRGRIEPLAERDMEIEAIEFAHLKTKGPRRTGGPSKSLQAQ